MKLAPAIVTIRRRGRQDKYGHARIGSRALQMVSVLYNFLFGGYHGATRA